MGELRSELTETTLLTLTHPYTMADTQPTPAASITTADIPEVESTSPLADTRAEEQTGEVTTVSSDGGPPSGPTPSRGKPVTVEDAQDSDDEDQAPSKAADQVGDAVSRAIAAAEAGEGAQPTAPPKHDWQAVWSPAQNAYYFYNSTVSTNETIDTFNLHSIN